MTMRELMQRMKKQREADVVEQVRTLLGDNLGEITVYRPTSKWQSILEELGLKELGNITACATCYSADESVFGKVEALLKKRYKAVVSWSVDDLGYRKIFAASQSADAEPSLLLCVNYYEYARSAVKAQFKEDEENADATNSDTDDLEIDDEDPFA